jgi:tetratricopeptide (TPR) repeat protein
MNEEKYKTGIPTDKGSLGYYSLLDWWNNEFSKTQQTYILEKYIPMGGSNLTTGTIIDSSASAINFLNSLHSWFTNLAEEIISEKILIKAESLIKKNTSILDIHFLYGSIINHYYKKRNIDSRFYDLAKKYCKEQIEISIIVKKTFQEEPWYDNLPSHKGYHQLAIILEKEKKYKEAIEICFEANDIGWNSDWNKRIIRLNKKLEKEKK